MMGSDARDMMGLPSAGPPKPTPAKTPKPKIKYPTGMSREVLDLKFEGAPPISIVAPKFKDKPKLPFKPRPWEDTPFGNSARKDGLILKHWRRKGDTTNIGAGMPVTPADSNAASEMETDEKATPTIQDSYWAKWNVKVERPQYTDEQYNTHLKSDHWTREETDYLVDLAIDFDLRWVLIGDRYDYKPSQLPKTEEGTASLPPPKLRSQEDLKARYYDLAAKLMVLQNPLSSMSSSEFDAHEKMTKFNPQRETQRKIYAEQLLSRTKEEKDEEEFLLKELSRIVSNQEKLSQERKALYERLETPPGTYRGGEYSTAMYQSSAGLTSLMNTLFTQNKNRELEKKEKRRSALEAGELQNGMDRSARHSLNGNDKRASIGETPGRRQLSAREAAKYGVSHPTERITAGVQFRHERIVKAGIAKSGVQTTRIGAALTELKIPPRLVMPTTKVVMEYERMIEKIKDLLDARKLTEKIEGEIKVWKAQREQQEKKDRGEEVKEEEGTQELDEDEDEEKEDETQNADESKVEDENEDDEDENGREEKDDSDEEVNQEDSDNNDDEDEVDGEVDESSIIEEAKDLRGSEGREEDEDEEQEQEEPDREGDEDGAIEDEEEDRPTPKSEVMRKRSASIISMSSRSSKRQRK